jgi:hypothetical protein
MQTKLTVPADVRAAKYVALVGGEIGAMIGEFKLATQTGMPHWAAWTLPLLLSLYAYASFRVGRTPDVAVALGLVAASQGAAHLIAATVVDVDWKVIVAVWSLMVPVALWRLHKVTTVAPEEPAEVAEKSDSEAAPPASPPVSLPTRTLWRLAEAVVTVWHLEQKGLKDSEIGAQMKISRVRVGQIRKEAALRDMVPPGAPWVAKTPVAA